MPPRSTAPPETPFAAPAPGDELIHPDAEALDELDRIIEESGPDAGWTIAVFRKSADGLKWLYCRRVPLHGFQLDTLPQQIGGGDYLLKITNSRNKIARSISVSFDPSIHPVTPPPPPAPPAAAAPAQDLQLQLLMKMAEQRDADRQAQTVFLQSLITAIVGRPAAAPTGPSLTELVQGVAAMKALAAPETTPATPVNTVLDAMKAALELRKDAAGDGEGGGEGDPVFKLLEKVIPPIMEAANRRQVLPPGNPPTPALAAANGGKGPTPADVPAELRPWLWLKKYTDVLLGWAQNNFDSSRAADVIESMIAPAHYGLLDQLLDMEPGARHSIFVQLDPRLQPFRTYLDEICRELAADEGDGDDVAGQAGADTPAPTN